MKRALSAILVVILCLSLCACSGVQQEDFDAAMELYNRLVEQGAYEVGYCELLRDMGMTVFTEDLDGCFAQPFNTLRDMCLDYDGVRPSASRVH